LDSPDSVFPLFSIVTVVLNDREGLLESASSVQSQSCTNYEWLIIDGDSSDGTRELSRELANKRCRFLSEKDKGIYDAMNKGVLLARGTYLIFMNGGDTFADRDVLAKIVDSLQNIDHKPDFLFGDAYELTESEERLIKKANSPRMISYSMFTHHQAMLYRRAFAEGTLSFEKSYRIAGDYDFTARFLMRGASTHYLGFPVCTFKRGGLSMTSAEVGRREALRVQKNVLKLSTARRLLNLTGFKSAALLKKYGRRFYDKLRFVKT
jgi:putative colanic acid biosynthesis glycosyltransferase